MNLLRLLRRIASLTMAFGVRILINWAPTYLNYADGPSHGEAVGIARQNQAAARKQSEEDKCVAPIPEEV